MGLQLVCPNLLCRKVLLVPHEARGKIVKCQHCGMVLKVPEGPPEIASTSSASRK